MGNIEHLWTKGDVFQELGAITPNITDTGQIAATCSLWRTTDMRAMHLVEQWFHYMSKHRLGI